jgi:hypothetical protein
MKSVSSTAVLILFAHIAHAQSYVEVTPPAAAVTASTNDGNVPGNTVDNNLSTRWSAEGDGQWIAWDLGSARTVGYVRLAVYQGNQRRNVFDLQTSSNATSWATIWSAESSGTTTQEQTYDFPDVQARYIRYLGHENNTNDWNSLTEVSIFATPSATPPPPPPTGNDVFGIRMLYPHAAGREELGREMERQSAQLHGRRSGRPVVRRQPRRCQLSHHRRRRAAHLRRRAAHVRPRSGEAGPVPQCRDHDVLPARRGQQHRVRRHGRHRAFEPRHHGARDRRQV